jgi:ubiquinone/menaquinone biosynthesis C-methylase UbiE
MTALARAGAGPLVGIDVAPEMIALARRLTAAEGLGDRCRFTEGDFLQSEVDGPFDIVLAMGVFDYIEDPVPFLRKMVESSGGLVIASFPGRSLVRMRLRSFRYRCRNCPIFFYREADLHALCRAARLDNYDLVFMPASGTGWVLVGRTGVRSPEPSRIG